jgi:hypothetical protein
LENLKFSNGQLKMNPNSGNLHTYFATATGHFWGCRTNEDLDKSRVTNSTVIENEAASGESFSRVNTRTGKEECSLPQVADFRFGFV